jgi:hypothetical protein
MANPSSRQGLIDYCLRELGHPVLEINLDEDQIEDRIDEAFQFYREYHFDAVELVYLKEQITGSTLSISYFNASAFAQGETLTGQTSQATCTVVGAVAGNKLNVSGLTDQFIVGETIVGSKSGQTGVITSYSIGNYDNKYITLNDSVTSVVRVLPFTSRTRGVDLFDIRYQILLNDIYSLQSTDIIYYSQVKTQLQLINDLLVGQKPVRFNRHQNRLFIDMDWESGVSIGEYIIVEAYRILDPDTFPDVYNDMFLKRYATALLKKQWGNNLKKFEGVQLPGGVTLNGQKIYDEAVEEIREIRQEIDDRYQLPVDFFTG